MGSYVFSEMEIDAIGEISNICLGSSASGAADCRYHTAQSGDCREE